MPDWMKSGDIMEAVKAAPPAKGLIVIPEINGEEKDRKVWVVMLDKDKNIMGQVALNLNQMLPTVASFETAILATWPNLVQSQIDLADMPVEGTS